MPWFLSHCQADSKRYHWNNGQDSMRLELGKKKKEKRIDYTFDLN